jgi:hypothetical protein
MNGKNIEQARFFEEQLFEAKQALFFVKTVREAKFLQSKITYLSQKVKELNGK